MKEAPGRLLLAYALAFVGLPVAALLGRPGLLVLSIVIVLLYGRFFVFAALRGVIWLLRRCGLPIPEAARP